MRQKQSSELMSNLVVSPGLVKPVSVLSLAKVEVAGVPMARPVIWSR